MCFANISYKKARVAILVSDKTDFKTRNIIRRRYKGETQYLLVGTFHNDKKVNTLGR